LTVATGLLFVLAFDVGFAADGFAVRDFGRLQSEIDVIALVELGDDDFNVLLPEPARRNSLVCGSREKRSAGSSSRIL